MLYPIELWVRPSAGEKYKWNTGSASSFRPFGVHPLGCSFGLLLRLCLCLLLDFFRGRGGGGGRGGSPYQLRHLPKPPSCATVADAKSEFGIITDPDYGC